MMRPQYRDTDDHDAWDAFNHRRRGSSPHRMTRYEQLRDLLASVEHGEDCIIFRTATLRWGGYGMVTVNGRNYGAHNLVCRLTYGPPADGMVAAHWCGVRLCVNPRHLRWATVYENNRDTYRHGTRVARERHPNTHLTEADVAEIRRRYATGQWTQRELAPMFGVGQTAIGRIVRNKRWVEPA